MTHNNKNATEVDVVIVGALERAGVAVEHLQCAGQIHTSVPAVDVVVTAEYAREAMATALRGFFYDNPGEAAARPVAASVL